MKIRNRHQRAAWLCGLTTLLITACLSSREPTGLGGESHFLRRCNDQCGSGLTCIHGVCTRGCVVGRGSCSDLVSDSVCTAGGIEPGEVAVCDLPCADNADCAALSTGHRCERGFCRAPAASAGDDAGSAPGDAGSASADADASSLLDCQEADLELTRRRAAISSSARAEVLACGDDLECTTWQPMFDCGLRSITIYQCPSPVALNKVGEAQSQLDDIARELCPNIAPDCRATGDCPPRVPRCVEGECTLTEPDSGA